MSLNKVMLIGNAGKDPEVRYIDTESGSAKAKVAVFSLATTERYRDRAGIAREHTEWHKIIAWNSLADFIEKYVRKGALLYVEGQIRTREWTDRADVTRTETQIAAETVRLLGRREENTVTDNVADRRQGMVSQEQAAGEPTDSPEDDGLPF